MLLPVCWAVAVFVLVYLPSAFQRKMIMGVDIPLCLLAGATLACLTGSLATTQRRLAIAVVFLLSLPSGVLFVCRDLRHVWTDKSETSSVPFLGDSEMDLFHWISMNTKPSDTILGPPNLMIYVPGYCERTVWCGHWSETENYVDKVRVFAYFSDPRTPDLRRRIFLSATHAQYLVAVQTPTAFPASTIGEVPYLEPVHANSSYVVYVIHPGRGIVAQKFPVTSIIPGHVAVNDSMRQRKYTGLRRLTKSAHDAPVQSLRHVVS